MLNVREDGRGNVDCGMTSFQDSPLIIQGFDGIDNQHDE